MIGAGEEKGTDGSRSRGRAPDWPRQAVFVFSPARYEPGFDKVTGLSQVPGATL